MKGGKRSSKKNNYYIAYSVDKGSGSDIMTTTVQCLWIGNYLPMMQFVCLQSFVLQGIQVHLYSYQKFDHLPPGILWMNAEEILPPSSIYKFKNSYAGFSDFFRYKLMYVKGGWWIDLDLLCIQASRLIHLDQSTEIVLTKENREGSIQTNPLKSSIHHPFFKCLYEKVYRILFTANLYKKFFQEEESIMWNEESLKRISELDYDHLISFPILDSNQPLPMMGFEDFCALLDLNPEDKRGQNGWIHFGPEMLTLASEQNPEMEQYIMNYESFHPISWLNIEKLTQIPSPKFLDKISDSCVMIDLYSFMWREKNMDFKKTLLTRNSLLGQIIDRTFEHFYENFCSQCILLICSSAKNASKRLQMRRTWLQNCPFSFLFVLSKPNISEPELNEKERILYVPMKEETYKNLNIKLKLAFDYMVNQKWEYIIKCDDDNYVDCTVLRRILFLQQDMEIGGPLLNMPENYDWVQWKELTNKPIWKGPWLEGYLYWIKKSALEIYVNHVTDQDLQETMAEDKLLTDMLRDHLPNKNFDARFQFLSGYPDYSGVEYMDVNKPQKTLEMIHLSLRKNNKLYPPILVYTNCSASMIRSIHSKYR